MSRAEVGVVQRAIRLGLERASRYIFPAEIRNFERTAEADEFLKQGKAVFIVGNHFSKRETVEIYKIPFMDLEMRKRHILTPIAEHQRKWWLGILHAITNSNIRYVPTDETERVYAQKGKKVENSHRKMREYASDLMKTIERGEVSVMFPQGSRRSKLYDNAKPNPQTMSSIYRTAVIEAKRRNKEVPDFAIMFLGFDVLSGVDNYEDLKDHSNRHLTYTITVGHTYSVHKLLERVGGNPKRIDEAVYEELEAVVSPKYIGEKPSRG